MSGWSRVTFLTVFAGLFVFAVVGTIVSARTTFAARPLNPAQLAGIAIDPDDLDVVEWPIGSQAIGAGVRAGDVVRAIGGRTPRTVQERDRLLGGPEGTTVALDLQSPGSRTRRVFLTRSPEHEREAAARTYLNPHLPSLVKALLGYVNALLFLGCAAILLVRRGRDPLAPWASLGILLVMVTTTPIARWITTLPPPLPAIEDQANLSCYLLMACVLALFPAGRFDPRQPTWAAIFAIVVFGELSSLLSDVERNLVVIACFVAVVALIRVRYGRMGPGVQRQQVRWALFGFSGSIGAYIIFAALIALRPAGYTSQIWTDLGTHLAAALVNALLIVGITVSLLRYRLYNADAAISRSAVYGALTVLLLAVFAGSEKLVEIIGEHYFGETIGTLAAVLAAAVAAATLVPLHHRVSHWAEHRFQRPLMHLRQGLPLLLGDLRETSGVERIARETLKAVNAGVQARASALTMGDASIAADGTEPCEVASWLSRSDPKPTQMVERSDPDFPVRIALSAEGHGHVGWLLVGPRPDGTLYGRADLDVLVGLADPVTRALDIAAHRQAKHEQERRERDEMRSRLTKLEDLIASLSIAQQKTA